MLKYLIQKGYVNVSKMLLENYPALGLSEQELIIILKLFEMLKNNQVMISVNGLSKKTSMSFNECSNVLNGLFNRGLISINLEYNKQGKAKESFNLDEFIKHLEQFFVKEQHDILASNNEAMTKNFVSMVEETFKRSLTPLELEIILDWSANGENPISVQQALAMATSANKLNIKYVDSCLVAINKKKDKDEVVLNENQSKILNDFYRNIK